MLHTLFIEVENVINSRPLIYMLLESDNQEAFTPNHFLLGSSNGSTPPGNLLSNLIEIVGAFLNN